MNNQHRSTISTLRYYAIGCVFVFSDDVLITMRSPEHPRARRYPPPRADRQYRPKLGHKNTRQVTPWGVLPGGRNLPRFFLWIGTDNHRRTSTRSARFPRRDMNPLPPYAELSAAVTFRPSTRAIESKLAPRHSMPMCARQPSASPPTGGVSTDERNNNPPAQAHASPFWRVVLREPSAVQARVRE